MDHLSHEPSAFPEGRMPDPPPIFNNISSDSVSSETVVRLERVTKQFPGIVANDRVDLTVRTGEFHAVIGENGAGKSTLLNILYGRYRPEEGRFFLDGQEVTRALASPADAIRRGIGLVSQHSASIPALTVLENILLGQEPAGAWGILNVRAARQRIAELAARLGLGGLDLHSRADRLSVAAGQKVEILRALFRGARFLMLDEPTATLAPAEADALFALLHGLTASGTTVLFVTHKLREVMTHSDHVTVLRRGRNAGDFLTAETTEAELLRRMVGREDLTEVPDGPVYAPDSLPPSEKRAGERAVLHIGNLQVRARGGSRSLQDLSLELVGGEILGVAGVDGSGQRELAESIVGLRELESGEISLGNLSITRLAVRERMEKGVAFIPEDRQGAGLVMDFNVAEDLLLGHECDAKWGGGLVLRLRVLQARANAAMRSFDIRGGLQGARQSVRTLSGGNQQKIVIARAMQSEPRLLVASQPTRGLDVEASEFVYRTLREARQRGAGILLFSLDLDELLALSDRIAVLFDGRIAGILARSEATRDTVGALMTGANPRAAQ